MAPGRAGIVVATEFRELVGSRQLAAKKLLSLLLPTAN
jgi:hypothetical protein